ncbi:hypothetical protein [Riemerella columbina]|uniref:hypothetical protein n=1 Tax=Riemerella columbina TaxID=103810 RepID=UPI000371A7F2|nr:hypothetical protein [Riemerella columbina]
MKKLLFISPDYYGFNEVVYDGLKKYSGMKVTHVISAYTQRYKYKNAGERIQNFFMKTFLNRNLKDEKQYTELNKIIHNNYSYDQIIVNRPDVLSKENLSKLRLKTECLKAFFWDSIDKIPKQIDTISYFDQCFSFDASDCNTYGFIKNQNFFFAEQLGNSERDIIYDALFWGTEDKRIDKLIFLLDYLNSNGISARAILYNHLSGAEKIHEQSRYITTTNALVPFSESYKISNRSKILIDLAHDNQRGLSFRPFEALGLQKKLITDNPNIKHYDFYNQNNICVIDSNHILIPKEFFTTPYEPVDPKIVEQYTLKQWVHTLINN